MEEFKRSRRRRREPGLSRDQQLALLVAVCIFLSGAAAALGISHIAAAFKDKKEDRIAASQVTEEEERLEGIMKAFENGESTLATLRKYYPDYLVLRKNGNYQFAQRDDTLKTHSFDSSKVRKNTDGTWGYVDGNLKVQKGMDVSSHQGEIDWEKVAKTNVEFVMIRAVYRGYESGKLLEDEQFRSNIEGASANGIKTGAYIFTQAINKAEVDEEVGMLKALLGAYEPEMPVVVDIEDIAGSTERIEQLSKQELTELTKYYVKCIEEAGYTPMLYLNIDSAVNMIELSEFEDVRKWFAVYDSDFYYPYAYSLWQYKDTGSVDGIEGNVDLDLYFPDL